MRRRLRKCIIDPRKLAMVVAKFSACSTGCVIYSTHERLGSVGIYGTGNLVHLPSLNPYPTCVLTKFQCHVFQVVQTLCFHHGQNRKSYTLLLDPLHNKRHHHAVLLLPIMHELAMASLYLDNCSHFQTSRKLH